jgi:leucyl-tRNA synthetase
VAPADVSDPNDPRDPQTGELLEVSYDKMSKSKYNGVDPAKVIETYGADTARMFILFKAPPEKDLEWDDADVEGQFRFLQRLWRLVDSCLQRGLTLAPLAVPASAEVPSASGASPAPAEADRELRRAVHGAITAVQADLEGNLQFNTAISELMKLSNAMAGLIEAASPGVAQEALRSLLLLLAPFAPHLAEELWQKLGGDSDGDGNGDGAGSIHRQRWPVADASALLRDTIPLVIQVKGKVRGSLEVPADADSATLEKLALASDIAQKWLEGQPPRRVIVVPGKLVNLVP